MPNLKSVFYLFLQSTVRPNRGSQKFERSLAMPAFSIPPKNVICLAYRLLSYVHFFPRLSIAVLSGRCEPPILGKGRGGRMGVGMVTVRKSVGEVP